MGTDCFTIADISNAFYRWYVGSDPIGHDYDIAISGLLIADMFRLNVPVSRYSCSTLLQILLYVLKHLPPLSLTFFPG